MGLWRSSSLALSPSSGCQAAGFHHDCGLLVFKVTTLLWATGKRNGQVKMPQDSLFLLKFHCFSCINTSWVTLSLWLISRSWKGCLKLFFAHVLFAFMGGRIFGCLYFIIFIDVTQAPLEMFFITKMPPYLPLMELLKWTITNLLSLTLFIAELEVCFYKMKKVNRVQCGVLF